MLRVILFAILISIAAAGHAAPDDLQERYELVKFGMSRPQVEDLVGRFEGGNLIYGPGERMITLSEGGVVDGDVTFLSPGDPEPPKDMPRFTGRTKEQVIAALGPPLKECFYHDQSGARFSFCFANEKMVSKETWQLPPPAADCSPLGTL